MKAQRGREAGPGVRPPTRSAGRSPAVRRARRGALTATAAAGLLLAGCAGGDGTGGAQGTPADSGEVLLQPAAAPGPDPFTASTVVAVPRSSTRPASPASPTSPVSPTSSPAVPPPSASPRGVRTVDGATPGLYGGTRLMADCDVERQARLLTGDTAKAGAFAQAAGINPADIRGWLRDLTPVVLRADTRVTGHGYRDGTATPFQAVLQSGSAVLVDRYGAPRVRCACGNPLRSPADIQGAAVYQGDRWDGFRAGRVVAVAPTQQVLGSLIIVNVADDTWIERKTGTRGEQDKRPDAPPPYDPGDRDVADTPVPDGVPTGPAGSAGPTAPTAAPPGPRGSGALPRPQDAGGASVPDTSAPEADGPPVAPPAPVAPDVPAVPDEPSVPDAPAVPDEPAVPDAPDGSGTQGCSMPGDDPGVPDGGTEGGADGCSGSSGSLGG
ncbi:DUF6777 domain-containing protein [Streptomyces sp. NPDC047928]|uniref:DUF6777 domain-containing protein n=1 Tax=unclassified Streptomyces TaxID=2593676 RepID=UPI0037138BC8